MRDLEGGAEAGVQGAAAQPGRHGGAELVGGVELEGLEHPVAHLGVEVDALDPGGLGDVRGGGEAPAGVAEVPAGLLRKAVDERGLPCQ
ncbi:MAG TPA: hypothetical protein VGX25_33580 [Actinophytocola sp.]|uniref:hypothetical protein n=1 Tax=Actinophytocola sp. TaxID=1872138 RepID=UPI002DDD1E9E|nr:hypothetical protein [Actinophytocola sp.]HEV2784345.1 hypothetical protein [Actinophytocola sp.]